MARIAQVYYNVCIGPMANYGRTAASGFSTLLSSELSRQTYDYTACVYDANQLGIILLPNYYGTTFIDNMIDSVVDPNHFTVVPASNYWSVCQATKWAGQHLVMEQVLVTGDTSATTNKPYSTAPNIYLSILRPSNWVGAGTTYNEYMYISFGMPDKVTPTEGYQISLCQNANPMLTGPAHGGEQPVLSLYDMDESERKDMAGAIASTWAIYNYNNDLIIRSSLLRKPWIIRGVGVVPSGFAQVAADGGPYAFNMVQVLYETDGSFITDWIDEGDAGEINLGIPYPLTENFTIATSGGILGSQKTVTTFPLPVPLPVSGPPVTPPYSTVTVELNDEQPTPLTTGGRMSRRYKVSLHGDGMAPGGKSYYTPIVRAISMIHRPVVYEKDDPIWIEVSSWMQKGSEQLALDPGASHAEFTFRNPYTPTRMSDSRIQTCPTGEFSWALQQLSLLYSGLPLDIFRIGQMAITYTVGYLYDDHSLKTSSRLYGLVRSRIEHDALNEMNYIMRVRDRAAQLEDNELVNSPCLLQFPIDEALALLAEHAGIHPDDIQLCGVISPGSIMSWWNRAPAPSHPSHDSYGFPCLDPLTDPVRYLLGQVEDFKSPVWLLNGENAWEAMQRIAQRYGYTTEFSTDGKLYIRDARYRNHNVSTCTISTMIGADQKYGASGVDVEQRIDGKVTAVQVEGRDQDNNAILYTLTNLQARDTPGLPGYVGYTIMKRVIDKELDSIDAVQYAAQYFLDNNITGGNTTASPEGKVGRRKIDITSPAASLWYLFPRDLIEVYDEATNVLYGFFRVVSVSSEFNLSKIQTHVEAEEIDINAPWSWPGYGMKPGLAWVDKVINRSRPLFTKLSLTGSGAAAVAWPPAAPYSYVGSMRWFTTSDNLVYASITGGSDATRPDLKPATSS